MWRTNKEILAWTVNSDEVAYIERRDQNMIINFINKDGQLRSGELRWRLANDYDVTLAKYKIENIWILQNIIIKTE